MPTTSIFSRTDGICAWQVCLNETAPAENIEVYGSHCGPGHHPAVVYAMPPTSPAGGAWKKFDRGWRHIVFPDWRA